MKRVVILFILLVILLLPGALAVKESKTSGWYKYIDSFTFNKATYTLRLMSGEYVPGDDEQNLNGGTLRIGKNDERFIVNLGECYEDENRTYCFTNKSFERKQVEIDAQGKLQPAIAISLTEYEYIDAIEIKRVFEKTKFALFEEGDVTITVTNTGDNTINNIRLSEIAPTGFNITRAQQNTVLSSNTIRATFILLPGKSWTTTYKIKSTGYEKATYQTSALYDTATKQDVEQKSATATLEVLAPYTIKATLPKKVERNTPTEFKLSITNNENEALQINNLKIYVPLSVGVSSRTNLNQYSFNVFSHKGIVDAKTTKDFLVRLQTPYVGNFVLSYEGDLAVKGKEYEISEELPLEVTTKGLNCYFTFNNPTLQAGRSLQYTVVIKNLGESDDYLNINGSITTPFETIPFSKSSIIKGQSETIINNRYTMPFSTEDIRYPFSIKAKYYTSAGQEFTCEEQNDYLVKGAETILLFDIISSADKPSPGKNVNLFVSVTNEIADEITGITITSTTDDPVRVTSETTKEFTTLESNKKVEVYTVEITIPEDYDKDTIQVITTSKVESHGYNDTIITTIPVKLPEPEPTTEETTTPEEKEETTKPSTPTTETTEEKQGFFAKVWQIIKNLW